MPRSSNNDALAELKNNQEKRRVKIDRKASGLPQSQHETRVKLAADQRFDREELRTAHQAEVKRTNNERAKHKPGKVGKIFGKISGYSKVKKALHNYQDRKRTKLYLKTMAKLKAEQSAGRLALARTQEMQNLDMQRKLRSLKKLEKRELNSFEESMKREGRIQARGGRDEMPSLNFAKEGDKQQKEKDASKIRRYGSAKKRDNDNDRGR